MLGNRTFILLYYKVPNAPVWNDTPPYYSNSHKNVKILMKWDFHSTILQGTKPLPLGATHLDTIQAATIWSLELGNIKGL